MSANDILAKFTVLWYLNDFTCAFFTTMIELQRGHFKKECCLGLLWRSAPIAQRQLVSFRAKIYAVIMYCVCWASHSFAGKLARTVQLYVYTWRYHREKILSCLLAWQRTSVSGRGKESDWRSHSRRQEHGEIWHQAKILAVGELTYSVLA